ncbi:MAG: GxxExxY protein [Caldilinea sp. CFX5]|nr:GxxExxY protein [Caldilinea sp. CFX5]
MSQTDPRTYAIIGACMEVHQQLGHGFLELVYHEALKIEFPLRQVSFLSEVELPVWYKGRQLPTVYRADFICFHEIIIEIKAIKEITKIEEAQLINYLKATGKPIGLLINFGSKSLEYRRFANHFSKSA